MKDQFPNELYVKVSHDGVDYGMVIDDKVTEVVEPAETASVGVYRLAEVREMKGGIFSTHSAKMN